MPIQTLHLAGHDLYHDPPYVVSKIFSTLKLFLTCLQNPVIGYKNPYMLRLLSSSGNATTIYVGVLNAVDASGNLVGKGMPELRHR